MLVFVFDVVCLCVSVWVFFSVYRLGIQVISSVFDAFVPLVRFGRCWYAISLAFAHRKFSQKYIRVFSLSPSLASDQRVFGFNFRLNRFLQETSSSSLILFDFGKQNVQHFHHEHLRTRSELLLIQFDNFNTTNRRNTIFSLFFPNKNEKKEKCIA